MTPPAIAPPPSPADAPRPPPSERRIATVRQAAERWKAQLIDTGGRNRLLYYRPFKASTLEVSPDRPEVDELALERLLKGRPTELRSLLPAYEDAADLAKRARNIFRKARENLEERGIDTLFLGGGQATWDNDGPTPAAPVVLIPSTLTPIGASQNEFKASIAGEPVLNPVLIHHVQTEHGVELGGDQLPANRLAESVGRESVAMSCDDLSRQCTRIPGFKVDTGIYVLANFAYATMPMVTDLERSVEQLATNDIVASLAGDEEAQEVIRDRVVNVNKSLPDTTPPADEFLVLDADASQNWAINTALQGESIVIEGPPGTGKSQTIANLISSLVARKKRVLFVAEKRAAIEAVTKRLTAVGLAEIVLDLHGGVKSKRELAQLLGQSLSQVGSIPEPATGDLHVNLVERRGILNNHVEGMHEHRSPWGTSAYELQAELIAAGELSRLPIRLPDSVVDRLTHDERREVRGALREWVQLGGSRMTPDVTPWATSVVTTPEDARAAYDAATDVAQRSLPEARRSLEQLLSETGLSTPRTIDEWDARTRLVSNASTTLDEFEVSLFGHDLQKLRLALEPASRNVIYRMWAHVTNRDYRAAKKVARTELKDGKKARPPRLHSLIDAASDQQSEWALLSVDGGKPRRAQVAGTAGEAFAALQRQIAALGAYVAIGDTGEISDANLQSRAHQLVADQTWLYRLPRLRELEGQLNEAGLAELLDAVPSRQFEVDDASAAFDYVVAKSIYDRLAPRDPRIASFDGALHERRVAEFRHLDEEHRDTTAARVLRAAAELAVATRDGHPDENRLVQAQAGRKRGHLPLRRLLEEAPNVVTALRPCWTMSPLLVAEAIPSDRTLFDVVIFDEASQIPPAHAIGALARADQAIVAGDRRQLPPTSFFLVTDVDEEAEDVDQALTSADFESVIDVLLAVPLRPYMLTWHYRSHDERLIAFSNAHLYEGALTTFPGVAGRECLSHSEVAHRPSPGMSTRSNPDEVERVVDLILDHASNRSGESLGVIAMGLHHAHNIDEGLRRRLQGECSREYDQFFDESAPEPFFVKNLERVQGDERDAIILSVGYGKQADGRLLYRFGPLNREGGERRLNVAVTRSRIRMTLVSSFSSHDMDPNRSSAQGVELLRHYLAFAASGGNELGEGVVTQHPMDAFELDVYTRLTSAGMPLTPQFGVGGYRIDFVASHPEYPGRMVLAIEADGASYHASATARDRDRLRQQVLEDLGWTFHRIWSTEWFRNPEAETKRAVSAWRDAARASEEAVDEGRSRGSAASSAPARLPSTHSRGPRPTVPQGRPITDYSHRQLVSLAMWIRSDTLLRTEDEMLEEMMRELGFGRRGSRIVAALSLAIRSTQ